VELARHSIAIIKDLRDTLQRVALFFNDQCREFTLQGHAVQHIVANVGACAAQDFAGTCFVDIGDDQLVQVATDAGDGVPGCQLCQLNVCAGLFIALVCRLDRDRSSGLPDIR
jgi:hypothetical protein